MELAHELIEVLDDKHLSTVIMRMLFQESVQFFLQRKSCTSSQLRIPNLWLHMNF